MDIEIKHVSKKLIVGIEIRTTNEQNRAEKDIPELWQKFFQEKIADRIPNKTGSEIFAVYSEYEGDFTKPYSYLIGYEVSSLENIPVGMIGKVVPEGEYTLTKTEGPFPASLIETWQKIWRSSLARAYHVDFEIYPEDFSTQERPEIQVYLECSFYQNAP